MYAFLLAGGEPLSAAGGQLPLKEEESVGNGDIAKAVACATALQGLRAASTGP